MATQTVKALCGKCRIPPEPVADRNAENWFACPKCGAGDTRERILAEVKKHVVEITAILAQESVRGALRGSKTLQLKSKPVQKRQYRFVSNLKA